MSAATTKRTKSHRCPTWCHICPDMIDACMSRVKNHSDLDEFDKTMPMCMGGVLYGMEGCYCRTAPEHRERRPRVSIPLTMGQFRELERRAAGSRLTVEGVAQRLLGEALSPRDFVPQPLEVVRGE